MFFERTPDYRPVFWWQGIPVYLTGLFVVFHVAGVIALLILHISGFEGLALTLFNLNGFDVCHGEVWRLFTYIMLDPNTLSSFFYLPLSMIFLFLMGRQLEEFIGRAVFLKLYLALILFPAALMAGLGFLFPQVDQPVLGYYSLIFGVFIALATIYPNVQFSLLPITLFWWAMISLGMSSVLLPLSHQFSDLILLWTSAATAYLVLRFHGAGSGFDWLIDGVENWQARRVARHHKIRVMKALEKELSLDEILEKISRSGMASLNSSEKATLERTRAELINRDKSR